MTRSGTIRKARAASRRRGGVSASGSRVESSSPGAPVQLASPENPVVPSPKTLSSGASYTDKRVEFYSLSDLAARWRVSRSAVYVYLRGYPVLDFAPAPGRRGHKIVSAEVVRQIERERERTMR